MECEPLRKWAKVHCFYWCGHLVDYLLKQRAGLCRKGLCKGFNIPTLCASAWVTSAALTLQPKKLPSFCGICPVSQPKRCASSGCCFRANDLNFCHSLASAMKCGAAGMPKLDGWALDGIIERYRRSFPSTKRRFGIFPALEVFHSAADVAKMANCQLVPCGEAIAVMTSDGGSLDSEEAGGTTMELFPWHLRLSRKINKMLILATGSLGRATWFQFLLSDWNPGHCSRGASKWTSTPAASWI